MFNIDMFQDVLQEQVRKKKLAGKTMDGYLGCIRFLEKECGNKEGPSAGNIELAIKKICSENKQMSKYVTAVKKYERDVLGSPKILLYGEPLARIRSEQPKASQGKKIANTERTYTHKINRLNDVKLKLAFRLQTKSGIRVAELASLIKKDLLLDDTNHSMKVRVNKGKGGKSRLVAVIDDEYLYNKMKEYVSSMSDDEKLFYSAAYLMKMAGKYSMETHDLRRINSRVRFRDKIDDGSSRREARSAVALQLGHDDSKVTNIYLGDEWKGGSPENEQS